MRGFVFVPLAVCAALACQDSAGPLAPVASAPGPVAAAAACPCWEEGTLATAFPAAHFYLSSDDGTDALTRFDHASGQQIQALVRRGADGAGACELASYGAGGRVEALAGADGLTGAQCEACAALLRGPAVRFGFVPTLETAAAP